MSNWCWSCGELDVILKKVLSRKFKVLNDRKCIGFLTFAFGSLFFLWVFNGRINDFIVAPGYLVNSGLSSWMRHLKKLIQRLPTLLSMRKLGNGRFVSLLCLWFYDLLRKFCVVFVGKDIPKSAFHMSW